MCSFHLSLLLTVILFYFTYCYFDVELTDGRSMYGVVMNFDGVKVKRVNHSIYAGVGNLQVYEDIDNSFEVELFQKYFKDFIKILIDRLYKNSIRSKATSTN